MKLNNKFLFINVIISSFLGILSIYFLPQELFEEYHLEKISEKETPKNTSIYYCDIDNDGEFEEIRYKKKDKGEKAIVYKSADKYLEVYNLRENEFFLSDYLIFSDFDKNNRKKIYFITAYQNGSYLNSIEYNRKTDIISREEVVFIDSVKYRNDRPDVGSSQIKLSNNKIIFNLMAGFSIQPRRIYSYDLKTKELLKSPLSSSHISDFEIAEGNILIRSNVATGNTISYPVLQELAKSTHPDTIRFYQMFKNRTYEYGDFSSYIMMLDSNLNFKFPPIEYNGWTNVTYSSFIKVDNKKYIVSLTISEKEIEHVPILEITTFEGELIRRKELPNYQGTRTEKLLEINPITNQIILKNNKTNKLICFDNYLNEVKEVDLNQNTTILGFKDLNDDNIPEFLVLYDDKIEIYQNDLESKTVLPLYYYKLGGGVYVFETYKEFDKNILHLGVGNTDFSLHYYHNKLHPFKYITYVLLIIAWYLFIIAIQTIQSKQAVSRLIKDKKKLELLVAEQTQKLRKETKIIAVQNKELNKTLKKLKLTQNQLVQSEKMISLGQLTAGLTHEMNNPLNFIQVGVKILVTNIHSMISLVDKYKQSRDVEQSQLPAVLKQIQKFESEIDFDEITTTISDVLIGTTRVVDIVASLRDFSRLDQSPIDTVDIHKYLDTSLVLLSLQLNEKNIQINKEYSVDLPEVECHVGQLNQVFVIILTNAIQSVKDKGSITISTKRNDQNIEIRFKDTGSGIKKEVLDKVFDPFFTTKDVGEGKGLGLSVTYGIIKTHKGTIKVESEEGKGSEFIINIPLLMER